MAVPIGLLSAVKRNSPLDHTAMGVALVGQSAPTFFLGILFILLFSLKAGLFPTSGRGDWEHLVLPALTLGAFAMASIARLTRSAVLEVLRADYIRTARAKGLAELARGAQAHLKNAALPIVTITALQFGTLLGGAVVTETVFAWPGHRPPGHPVDLQPRLPGGAVRGLPLGGRVHRHQLRRSSSSMASSIPASVPAEVAAVVGDAVRGGGRRRPAHAPPRPRRGRCSSLLLVVGGGWRRRGWRPRTRSASRCAAGWPAPTLEAADGRAHLLGTDHLGRDVLSRVIYGARVSLLVGFVCRGGGRLVGAGARASWPASAAAGRTPSIMTLADAQLAFPFILLAIGIIAVLGPSFPTLVVVIGLSGWVSYARILRSQVLVLRSREFVEAIHALGGSVARVGGSATSCPT